MPEVPSQADTGGVSRSGQKFVLHHQGSSKRCGQTEKLYAKYPKHTADKDTGREWYKQLTGKG